ncbi:signal peptidase I [Cytobacillus depressus]|uniref:Signal peptidase I n=1 Tax=Cytobacillus depressus TaxID=1602942 RepID=A0A6L3V991_9BACI|nr:signal peptidase I [Cytobacillus depressus]KAB2334525.1 signal peptidase I [Cytobacillus depressus]
MTENTKKEVFSWIKSLAFAFIVAFICREFLFLPTTVFGESMSPTFQDQERVVISKTAAIERFDVVVFDAPDVAGKKYIKRVIGLPGDRIEMRDDVLYINGKAFEESYLKENKEGNPLNRLTGDFLLQEVPKDSLFVMGDNRLNSKDSRHFGFIPINSVIGEVKFRFYPFQAIGIPK